MVNKFDNSRKNCLKLSLSIVGEIKKQIFQIPFLLELDQGPIL